MTRIAFAAVLVALVFALAPTFALPVAAQECSVAYHTAVAGDTPRSIATRYASTASDLPILNPGQAIDDPMVGQTIMAYNCLTARNPWQAPTRSQAHPVVTCVTVYTANRGNVVTCH